MTESSSVGAKQIYRNSGLFLVIVPTRANFFFSLFLLRSYTAKMNYAKLSHVTVCPWSPSVSWSTTAWELPGGECDFFSPPRVNLHLPGIGGYRSTGDPDFNAIFCGLVEHIPSKSTAAFECNKLFINTHINPWTEQQGKTSNPFFPQDMKCSKLIIPEASRAGEPVIKVDVSTDLRIAVVGHRRTKYCPSGLVIPQITCCFMP